MTDREALLRAAQVQEGFGVRAEDRGELRFARHCRAVARVLRRRAARTGQRELALG